MLVPEGVVDLLEAVQVDVEQTDGVPVASRAFELEGGESKECPTVQKTGEGIDGRLSGSFDDEAAEIIDESDDDEEHDGADTEVEQRGGVDGAAGIRVDDELAEDGGSGRGRGDGADWSPRR